MSAAPRTAVVTDTTAYLPDGLASEHDFHRVSLYVTLDGVQQRATEIAGTEYGDFFERLRRSVEARRPRSRWSTTSWSFTGRAAEGR